MHSPCGVGGGDAEPPPRGTSVGSEGGPFDSPTLSLVSFARDDAERPDTRRLILESARREIDEFGIIGLRLARVARGANVSIPLISRHFGGRDGLLAEVLGDWYAEFVKGYQEMVEHWIESSPQLTLEQFAMLSPKPRADDFKKARELRLQVLATAVQNDALRARISETTTESHHWTKGIIARCCQKLPEADRHFDERIFTVLLFNTMFVFTDLVPDASLDDAEYSQFLVELIRSSSTARIG